MPKINTYTNNASIEDNDKLLTYDTGAGATKLTLFSTIKDWMLARMAAVTSRTAGSSDDILTVNNGTVGKSTVSSVAKSMVEDYTGSLLGGSTRSVKAAIDATTTALSTLEQETDDAITDLRDDLTQISEVVGSGTFETYDYVPIALDIDSRTATQAGITFTQNADGSVYVKGTNTSNSENVYSIKNASGRTLTSLVAGKKYLLSGCPSGGSVSTYRLGLKLDSGGDFVCIDTGNGVIVNITESGNYRVCIGVGPGTTVDHTFKPVIAEQVVTGQTTGDILSAKDTVAREGLKDLGVEDGEYVDPSSFVKLSGYYIGGATPYKIAKETGTSCIYVECLPDTNYAITKISSARFIVAYSTEVPESGTLVYGRISFNEATIVNIKTGSDAKYLIVYYKHGSDTLDDETIYNSIRIQIGEKKINVARYDIVQHKTDDEKHQLVENIGVVDSNSAIMLAINDVYALIMKRLEIPLRMLARVAYLENDGIAIFKEVNKMFNLIENQYMQVTGLTFNFNEIDESPIFGDIYVQSDTNVKRAAIVSLFPTEHPITDIDDNDTAYFPMVIPKGAAVAFSNNSVEAGIGICYHVLKYDSVLKKFIRIFASSWQYSKLNGDQFMFDLSNFNDGTFYLICGLATCDQQYEIMNRNKENAYTGYKSQAHTTNLNINQDMIKGINLTII